MVRSRLAALMVALVAAACSTVEESTADGPLGAGSTEATVAATAMADDEDGQGSATQGSEATAPSSSPDVVATRGEADDLVGTWHDKRDHVLRFLRDGNYDVDRGYTAAGTYEFDGDVLIMKPGDRSPCHTDLVARYEVRFSDDGATAHLRRIEDACDVRFGALRLGLEREG